jgi:hypothetical protein
VAAADLNNDGNADLVVAGYYGTLSVLLNEGDGAFGAPFTLQVNYGTYGGESLVVADLDGDGLPDVSLPDYGTAAVLVLPNQTYQPTLELLDADGNVLASGVAGSEGLDRAIADFVAPADGVYYIRVGGRSPRDYSLVVTRNAEIAGKTRPEQSASQSTGATAEAISGLGLSASADSTADLGVVSTVVGSSSGASRVKGTGADYVDRAIDSLIVAPAPRPSIRAATKTSAVRSPAAADTLAVPRPIPWKRSTARSRLSSVTA